MDSKRKILIKFGDRVREIRKEKGISQEQLSFQADLHRTYIGMIERAEKNITLVNIEKIANALKVSVNDLMNFDGSDANRLRKKWQDYSGKHAGMAEKVFMKPFKYF
ncbi:MAG: helix-turn-helix domain-containing protein [Chitinophagaceae bacterium]|nr:helix-turn-helix domain-containing protein [Chitinophagaceae bacterium]